MRSYNSDQQRVYNTFISGEFAEQRRKLEQQKYLVEIEDLFQNYLHTLGTHPDPCKNMNTFIATFYNKYPEGLDQKTINFMKEYLPKTI